MTQAEIREKASRLSESRRSMSEHVAACANAGVCPKCGDDMTLKSRSFWDRALDRYPLELVCRSCSQRVRGSDIGKGCVVWSLVADGQ